MSRESLRAMWRRRLSERSTWAGIGGAITAAAWAWNTGSPEALGAAVVAAAFVVIPEKKP